MIFANKISSKKGIIFDFDGTIADTKPAIKKGLRVASLEIYNHLRKKGMEVRFKDFSKEIFTLTCKIAKKGIDDRNIWWELAIKKFSKGKINPKKSFLDAITKNHWETVIKQGILYKNTLDVLKYLKNNGYYLGLLTDSDGLKGFKKKRIDALFDHKKWFDSVVIAGEDTKKIKPNREPFFLILKNLGLKPSQAVFVGDDPYRDILGAKKIGMKTILIKRHKGKTEIKPDKIIYKISELRRIF